MIRSINRSRLFTLFIAALGLGACSESESPAVSQQFVPIEPVIVQEMGPPPNILLIISDDIGRDVTSGMQPGMIDALVAQYGPNGLNHPDYQSIAGSPAVTPVLDQFAAEGMLFTNVWAHPFCSPTRASILTGLYSGTEVFTYADPLSQNHVSFVRMLKEQGNYSTAAFGKWHMAGLPSQDNSYPGIKPREAGFDLFKGNLHAALNSFWDYDYEVQDADTPADQWRSEAPPLKSLPGIAPTTFAPVVKIADAIEWISDQESADPEKPWFAWVAFNLSHATRIQQPSAMAVPDADTLNPESLQEMQACGGEFGSNNTGTCSGESLMRAMTSALDTVTGKLLEAVNDIDSNTYIIYIGDNGTPMYGRPDLDFIDNMYITRDGRGKGTAYESGVRVPMVIKGPGITANTTSDEIVHAADIFPTSLTLAGLQAPENVPASNGRYMIPLDSVSLTPILNQQADKVRDPNEGYLMTETSNLMTGGTLHVGVRNASHKIVCVGGVNVEVCEFYNLLEDPLEEYPLAIPQSCDGFNDDTWSPADDPWHYCRLSEVAVDESFMPSL